MKPYYQDDAVTLYHADCRAVLPLLSPADVLVTDPPYGVEMGKQQREVLPVDRHGFVLDPYDVYEDSYEAFQAVVVPTIRDQVAATKRGAVFSGAHLQDLPKADAIGGIYMRSGAGRHRWGFKTFLPILLYGSAPQLQNGARPNVLESNHHAEQNGHPCPKPLAWMRWLVDLVSLGGETVIDPFAGSGTTLRAAKDLGRHAIGIELSERYCEIAARLCAQEVLDVA